MPVTHYRWDRLSDNLLAEIDETGATTVQYTNEPSQFGKLISQRRNGVDSYHHFDAQLSTRQLTDESQTVTDSYDYSAFGETVASSGTTENPFRFQGAVGYYTNDETDDIYIRRRTYRPSTGRWLSTDPLGFVDGPNLYLGYFIPNGVDPNGLTKGVKDIGMFIDGAGQRGPQQLGLTVIQDLYSEYGDDKRDFSQLWWTNLMPMSLGRLVERIRKVTCKEYCEEIDFLFGKRCSLKEFNEHLPNVDLFGWSRGAVTALAVAQALNDKGCECKLHRKVGFEKEAFKHTIKPVKVRFLGLIDPVSAGLGFAKYPKKVPNNVMSCWNAVSVGTDFTDTLIFKRDQIIPLPCKLAFYIGLLHSEIGFDGAGANDPGTVKN